MKSIKILITAGGTSEKIDDVRRVTNTSTGKLGALTADEYMKIPNIKITYVCGENAITPADNENIEIIKVCSVRDVKTTLENLFQKNKYDAVIHAMAISDYSVKGTMDLDSLAFQLANSGIQNNHDNICLDDLSNNIKELILEKSQNLSADKKISSEIDNLMIFMNKSPKIISMIKKLQPNTVLVGFKLLSGVSEDQLINVAHTLLTKNKCDFVLANDLDGITAQSHQGLLINKDKSYQKLYKKEQIAKAIVKETLRKIKENSI